MPKLRDSCVACAASKVRCHKEKPSCSKCVARAIPCEYVRSKRGGRNPAARSEAATSTSSGASEVTTSLGSPQLPISPVSWFAPVSTVSDSPPIPTPATTSAESSRGSITVDDDSWGPSPSTRLTGLDLVVDQMDPATSSYLDDLGALNNFAMVFGGNDTLSSVENLLDLSQATTPLKVFPTGPSDSNGNVLPNLQDQETDSNPCQCFLWTVSLAKQCFTESPPDPAPSPEAASPTRRIQAVVSQNKQAIDSIDAILQCSCYHDNYLLVMLSIILLKVIDAYADAATNKRPHSRSPVNSKANSTENLDAGEHGIHTNKTRSTYGSGTEVSKLARNSMHLILGELHRPQWLVNQLSTMLKAEAKISNGRETGNGQISVDAGPGNLSSINVHSGSGFTFSDVLLKQLGLDLRRRLQDLSLEIREALKRE